MRANELIGPTTTMEAERYIRLADDMGSRLKEIHVLNSLANSCGYCSGEENVNQIRLVRTDNFAYYYDCCMICAEMISKQMFSARPIDKNYICCLRKNTMLCSMGLGKCTILPSKCKQTCECCQEEYTTHYILIREGDPQFVHESCIISLDEQAQSTFLAYLRERLWWCAAWMAQMGIPRDIIRVVCASFVSLHNPYWHAIEPFQV